MASDNNKIRHGLSFDIECYYSIVWKDYLNVMRDPTEEVDRNTTYLLDMLAQRGLRATFFVLGNIARCFPSLVRRIAEEGHELGVHGNEHRYIDRMSPAEFREELRVAIDLLEQAGCARVQAHRAPAFSISRDTPWALDIMQEQGIRYDSSIFPVRGKRYGIADAPLGIHRLDNGMYEIPLTVVEVGERRLPAAGGGYFRVFPYRYTRWAMRTLESIGRPAVTYFHPHELELSSPRVGLRGWSTSLPGAARLARFNAMQGIGRGKPMRAKLERLLADYDFGPLGELLPD